MPSARGLPSSAAPPWTTKAKPESMYPDRTQGSGSARKQFRRNLSDYATLRSMTDFVEAIPFRRLRGYFYPGTNKTSVGERPHALQGTLNFLLHVHGSSFLTAGGQLTHGQTLESIKAASASGAHRFSERKASAPPCCKGRCVSWRMPKRFECGRKRPWNRGPGTFSLFSHSG